MCGKAIKGTFKIKTMVTSGEEVTLYDKSRTQVAGFSLALEMFYFLTPGMIACVVTVELFFILHTFVCSSDVFHTH